MCKAVLYRHNIMNINSIDTFLSVKGGFNKGQRDVYFVRMLGCTPDIGKEITAIDERMGKETFNKRLFYKRINSLPMIAAPDDMQFYSEQYEKWKTEKSLSVKNNSEAVFSMTLGNACKEILDKYRIVKPNATESIEKNLIVKMLFWLDDVLGDALKDWDERKCYKIIADNIQKEQDYLFYYMLTLIGCDVLLMERSADIEISDKLKSISLELKAGSYCYIDIPKFVPYKEENIENSDEKPVRKNNAQPQQTIKVEIAPRRPKQEEKLTQRTIINTNASGQQEANDKSFEELALLASSIVMITVFNHRGQPEATGSGIMIGRDGFILTNNHVTRGGCFFQVQIEDDDNVYNADEIIKSNATLDLAVIRIDRKLRPLPIYNGNKKLVRGQKVVAIGSPLGLFNSVSDGIISGFRNIDDVDMSQFTAPISHGSSGGALLNMQGQVIGISTAGIDKGQNINLAVGYENIRMFAMGFI